MSLPAAKEPASCNVANLSSMLQEPIQKLRRVTAPIEKEMLSVVFGLTGFHTSTYGRQVTVNKLMTTNHLLQYSSDPGRRISFDFRECCAELRDVTFTSSRSKAKTCLLLMLLADPIRLVTLKASAKKRLKPSDWLFKIKV